jgi:hypothetical protein
MNKEFNRMQKLAGLLTENMGGTDLDSTASDVYDYFSKMSSSTSTDRREYIKNTYGLSDNDTETVMMKVTDMMVGDDDMREGVAAYEYEKGKKAGEMGMEEGLKRTIRESQKQKSLREKIREMILAEMDGAAVVAGDYDPVAEAKKDKEEVEDVEVEDVDVTDEKMVGNDDPKVAEIQDLLNQLQDAAEELGDEKLLIQIGNTITFFTREHVATADNMG